MHPSLQFFKQTFKRFNAEIFISPLPEIPIKLTNAGSSVGRFAFPRFGGPNDKGALEMCCFKFSTNFDLPEEEWEDVVIHEMIHFAIWYFRIKDTSAHGPSFRKLMKDINTRFGRHISIRHKTVAGRESTDKRRRKHIVCLSTFTDGKQLLTVVAQSKYAEIRNVIDTRPDIKETLWFYSYHNFFNRYPHVQTPKFFKILDADRPALDEILSSLK